MADNNFQKCHIGKIGRNTMGDLADAIMDRCIEARPIMEYVSVFVTPNGVVYAHHDGMCVMPPMLRKSGKWMIGRYEIGATYYHLTHADVVSDLQAAL